MHRVHKGAMADMGALAAPSRLAMLRDIWRGRAYLLLRAVTDAVLPHRCAQCSAIVAAPGFCAGCWTKLDFLAGPACARCDLPLPQAAGEGALCGGCMADPPPYERVHVPLAYGPGPRALVMRLKYGRRVALARQIAGMIVPMLAESDADPAPLLVPVPLHRWRIWQRGFNQSAEIARHLSHRTGWPLAVDVLVRSRSTRLLRGLGRKARAKEVRGAFAVPDTARPELAGRTVFLVDDVFTTGATTAACARTLLRAGAARVEIVAFARVVDGRETTDVDSFMTAPDI
jgi:ComF family protein